MYIMYFSLWCFFQWDEKYGNVYLNCMMYRLLIIQRDAIQTIFFPFAGHEVLLSLLLINNVNIAIP